MASDADTNSYAMVWSGTAASAVNLNDFLPAGFTSVATSIDGNGNIFGLGYDADFNMFAVEWTAVPEPGWGMIVVVGGWC